MKYKARTNYWSIFLKRGGLSEINHKQVADDITKLKQEEQTTIKLLG